jgi:hypothetical protein
MEAYVARDDIVGMVTLDTAGYVWLALDGVYQSQGGEIVKMSQPMDPTIWDVPELRPPDEYADRLFHWIQEGSDPPEPAQWDGNGWEILGDGYNLVGSFSLAGYRYLGPAEWQPSWEETARRATTENAELHSRIAELEARVAIQSETIARLAGVQPAGWAYDFGVPQRSEHAGQQEDAAPAPATHPIPLPRKAMR